MAILIAEGKVERVFNRAVTTPYGEKTAYNVKLDDNEFYSIGFKAPAFGEGDKIQFVYSMNGKFRNAEGEIEILDKAETKVSTAAADVGTVKVTKDDYWTAKAVADQDLQYRLDVIGSRNSAIAAVTAAVELGLLKMPATKGKGYDAFLAAIDEQTRAYCLLVDNHYLADRSVADDDGMGHFDPEEDVDPADFD